jgi:hypothetical protein
MYAQQKRSGGKNCLIFVLGMTLACFCGLVAIGGGGYYMYTNGSLDRRSMQNALGLGTGEVSIVNLADEKINTDLDFFDTEQNDWTGYKSEPVESFDVNGFGGMQKGWYRLEITSLDGTPLGQCQLQIKSGDVYRLVVVPEGIAISLEGFTPQSADDLKLNTTSLCQM